MIVIALRTARGLNNREHHMARHRRVKAEREAVAWMLPKTRPALPCVVTLTRVAPSSGLDVGDNLEGSLKAARDQVADWLGIDDRDPRVQWRYDQRRSRPRVWQVWVSFEQPSDSGSLRAAA